MFAISWLKPASKNTDFRVLKCQKCVAFLSTLKNLVFDEPHATGFSQWFLTYGFFSEQQL